VHYWADLQSVQGFCCYDNMQVCELIALYIANAYSVEREMSASASTRSLACYFVPVDDVNMPRTIHSVSKTYHLWLAITLMHVNGF